MPSFSSDHKVNHKADEMFRLVADVERYPEFVPLCQDLHVRGRKELDGGRTVLVADMTVAYKLFKETFTSRVELRPQDRTILVEYLDGPFKHLENKWTFEDAGEGSCNVGFYISYEFRSRTLGSLMGVMFEKAFRKFSSAFEARADQVYGT
ncbi:MULTISPECIES: type II toxin-antitoxin system RatA family toxin [Stappiaceae]|jgi:coenzyme Q-binding protein COQ10|uniref:Ribosome association toxin RatA n=2 Tax=Roseibium TaxID=150830 RepID=A0A0M6Y0I7_9HYPH|nr:MULTISPECIES: type II toxin-antitoxin system RatA family toxin [Stappiaceae]MCR9283031.1 type II toxin-antitoxin system RatA family toxin [Paracoccaceae bacterium]MEC9405080.1 type II toxin-antitoxin system RatA family toxin [Pseudomonadota bacterium]AMN53421.1 cyclase [Labrenzia sp. CP4]AQQ06646.1 ubiquinone-binding protein [Roseibium aggregatum]ERS01781.1 cyclase [Labrenzia sp. C1B70]